MKPLFTLKQELFIEAYVGKAQGNATEAARIAGYKGSDLVLGQVGAENLKKPHIAERIKQRVEEAAMGADQVLKLLTDHATATLEDFFDFSDPKKPVFSLTKAQSERKLHLIKKMEFHDVTGAVKAIWLHDSQSALALMGKYHKLFTEKVQHEGADGLAMPVLNITLAK